VTDAAHHHPSTNSMGEAWWQLLSQPWSPCSQVRGKTVYLQYSTRNEIVNAGGGGGERPSNCLLVTLENLDVRIPSPVVSDGSATSWLGSRLAYAAPYATLHSCM